MADPAALEVDRAEALVKRKAETARLLSHREELENVGKTRLFEAALDCH
jgi:hypothetical protein